MVLQNHSSTIRKLLIYDNPAVFQTGGIDSSPSEAVTGEQTKPEVALDEANQIPRLGELLDGRLLCCLEFGRQGTGGAPGSPRSSVGRRPTGSLLDADKPFFQLSYPNEGIAGIGARATGR